MLKITYIILLQIWFRGLYLWLIKSNLKVLLLRLLHRCRLLILNSILMTLNRSLSIFSKLLSTFICKEKSTKSKDFVENRLQGTSRLYRLSIKLNNKNPNLINYGCVKKLCFKRLSILNLFCPCFNSILIFKKFTVLRVLLMEILSMEVKTKL